GRGRARAARRGGPPPAVRCAVRRSSASAVLPLSALSSACRWHAHHNSMIVYVLFTEEPALRRPSQSAESFAAALALRDAARHAQHVLAMELQIPPLALREGADVHLGAAVDTHTLERYGLRDRRQDQLSGVLK